MKIKCVRDGLISLFWSLMALYGISLLLGSLVLMVLSPFIIVHSINVKSFSFDLFGAYPLVFGIIFYILSKWGRHGIGNVILFIMPYIFIMCVCSVMYWCGFHNVTIIIVAFSSLNCLILIFESNGISQLKLSTFILQILMPLLSIIISCYYLFFILL